MGPRQLQGVYPGEAKVFSGSASHGPDLDLKTGTKGLKQSPAEVAEVDGTTNPTDPVHRVPGTGGSTRAAGAVSVPVPITSVVATNASPSAAAAAGVRPPLTRPADPPATSSVSLHDGVAFSWPAAGTVLQNFDQTHRKGLALGGMAGDVVRSAADGRVIFSGSGPRGYGNLIIVKHDSELLSVYAHNRSLAVKEGESITRGQKIAELGTSGTDTPKLHFEIRQQGKPINPLAVLPRR